jgi:hypothetical protein
VASYDLIVGLWHLLDDDARIINVASNFQGGLDMGDVQLKELYQSRHHLPPHVSTSQPDQMIHLAGKVRAYRSSKQCIRMMTQAFINAQRGRGVGGGVVGGVGIRDKPGIVIVTYTPGVCTSRLLAGLERPAGIVSSEEAGKALAHLALREKLGSEDMKEKSHLVFCTCAAGLRREVCMYSPASNSSSSSPSSSSAQECKNETLLNYISELYRPMGGKGGVSSMWLEAIPDEFTKAEELMVKMKRLIENGRTELATKKQKEMAGAAGALLISIIPQLASMNELMQHQINEAEEEEGEGGRGGQLAEAQRRSARSTPATQRRKKLLGAREEGEGCLFVCARCRLCPRPTRQWETGGFKREGRSGKGGTCYV